MFIVRDTMEDGDVSALSLTAIPIQLLKKLKPFLSRPLDPLPLSPFILSIKLKLILLPPNVCHCNYYR